MLTVNLSEILNEYDKEEVNNLLRSFSCLRNEDLQNFLYNSAIEFSDRNVSKTYLIFESEENPRILAYFSLAFTALQANDFDISRTLIGRMDGFRRDAKEIKVHLIGQIGKNDSIEDNPINLARILQEVFTVIKDIRAMIGGRFAILECNNFPPLIALYERHGFQLLQTKEVEDNLITMCIKIPE